MMKQILIAIAAVISFAGINNAEIQVNIHTTYDQKSCDLAMGANGKVIIAWQSYKQMSQSYDVFVRIFDANMVADSNELPVNQTTDGKFDNCSVTSDSEGNFIVVWQGPGASEPDGSDIFGRIFDPNGQAICDEFYVNSQRLNDQDDPEVARNGAGLTCVVWQSILLDESEQQIICGQLFDDSGLAIGDEFQIDQDTYDCRYPDVAIDGAGNFAVVWVQYPNKKSIMARCFDSTGMPRTDAFTVNDETISSLTKPSLAMNTDGFFVVTWDGHTETAAEDDIHAKVYDPNVEIVTEQFVVNSIKDGRQEYPAAAINDAGRFAIVWQSQTGLDANEYETEVFIKRFDADANPVGVQFRLNDYMINKQTEPVAVISQSGRIITGWGSYDQDGSRGGVYAKAIAPAVTADLNEDCIIDFSDYLRFAQYWQQTGEAIEADFNNDGIVDNYDLMMFLYQWLATF